MNKAVLFDMDGLMLETKLTWQVAEKRLLSDYGKVYDIEIAKKYQGMRVRECCEVIIKEYQLPIYVNKATALLTQYIVDNYDNPALTLLPGCYKLVKDLRKSKQFFLGIASSSPKPAILAMAKKFGFIEDFDLIMSSEEVPNGKPAPDVYLKSAELLDLTPKDCVVLEDSPKGIESGQRAGMKTIAVCNRQFYKPSDFNDKVDKLVLSLEELTPEIINQILR